MSKAVSKYKAINLDGQSAPVNGMRKVNGGNATLGFLALTILRIITLMMLMRISFGWEEQQLCGTLVRVTTMTPEAQEKACLPLSGTRARWYTHITCLPYSCWRSPWDFPNCRSVRKAVSAVMTGAASRLVI